MKAELRFSSSFFKSMLYVRLFSMLERCITLYITIICVRLLPLDDGHLRLMANMNTQLEVTPYKNMDESIHTHYAHFQPRMVKRHAAPSYEWLFQSNTRGNINENEIIVFSVGVGWNLLVCKSCDCVRYE